MTINEHFPIRTAQVGAICVISAASGAAVQFGDRGETNAKLSALAVQRAEDHTSAGDVYFESYPLFNRQLPELTDPLYDTGKLLRYNRTNGSPCILVGYIRIIAAGSASSIQIGNSMRVTSESRIKHIRQYPKQEPAEQK